MNPPFVRADADAERAVLGAVLLDGDALAALGPRLAPGDFYHPHHAFVFEAMGALGARHEPIDVVTLAAELRTRGHLNTVGGPQFLGALTDAAHTTAHLEHHARIVAGHAEARRIEAAAVALVRAARDPGRDADALRALAVETLGAIGASATAHGPRSFADLAQLFYGQLEATLARGPGIDGLTTGLDGLDALLAGLHPGELVVIGARPRVGKTSLAMQMCVAAARAAAKPVLAFSLEMSALSLFARTACSAAGVEGTFLRQGLITQDRFAALTQAVSELAAVPVYLDDASGTTIADVRARAVAMKARHGGLALVVVDYLQLVEATSSRAGTREREVAMMSRGLKILARELGCPVVVLSQLNREVDKRNDNRPQLSDLRESGALEQDSDVVIFLYRDVLYHPDTDEPDVAEVIVAKQRSGPSDTVKVKWIGALTRFDNLERADDAAPLPVHRDDAEEF